MNWKGSRNRSLTCCNERKANHIQCPFGLWKVHHCSASDEPGAGLAFSISATSRQPKRRRNGWPGIPFHCPGKIQGTNQKKAFVEWEEVYPGQYYGTLHSELDRIWELGGHAIFDIDVLGGLNLKKRSETRACAIFIEAPSLKFLKNAYVTGEATMRNLCKSTG